MIAELIAQIGTDLTNLGAAGLMGGREMDLRGILRRVAGLRRRKAAD